MRRRLTLVFAVGAGGMRMGRTNMHRMTTGDLSEYLHEYIASRTDEVSYDDMQTRLHDLVDIAIDHFTWPEGEEN
jgi:hypothetical protein